MNIYELYILDYFILCWQVLSFYIYHLFIIYLSLYKYFSSASFRTVKSWHLDSARLLL